MFYNFPDQTIPESKKDEKWHRQHILNFVSFTRSSNYKEQKLEIEKLYYAYAAKIHPADENLIKKTITERYCDLNLGPGYDVYPLIENTIEQILGDYRLRPLRLYALTQNPDAVVGKLDEMYDALLEKITRKVHAEIEEEEGLSIPTDKPDMKLPENDDIEFFKNYRTNSEKQAETILYFLLVIKKEKEKIYQALLHYLIAGTCSMIMTVKDGHPSLHVPNILACDYDTNPHSVVQDDPQYYAYTEFIGINDIFNTYDLTKEQKEKVIKYSTISANNLQGKFADDWFFRNGNDSELRIRTINLIWKSRIKRKFKKYINKSGNEEMKILPEDYRVRPKEKDDIVELDIENLRHCTMIGPDMVLEWGQLKDQLKCIGNKKKRFIHVVGLNVNNNTGTNTVRSIAKKLKFLQDYASEILYEIKIAMRQVDGGVLVYDLSNIPKEWTRLGITKAIERVNYSIKKDRIMFINSADKKSTGYASSVQLSQKTRLGDLTALLALIEDLAQKVSGLNGAKTGQSADYAKTGVAQMNMLQSSARLENVYGPFDTFVEKFLERIVLKAQHLYKEGDIFNYYAGDNGLQFLKIMPDFFMDDLGITLSDPRKEMEAKQIISQAASQMLPNMQDPQMILEMIKIHWADSASEAISILERGVQQMNNAMEERAKQAQAAQQAEAEAKAKAEEAKLISDRERNQTQVAVANIYADNKTQSDQIKETNANLRKAAEIEAKIHENVQKNKNKNVLNDN